MSSAVSGFLSGPQELTSAGGMRSWLGLVAGVRGPRRGRRAAPDRRFRLRTDCSAKLRRRCAPSVTGSDPLNAGRSRLPRVDVVGGVELLVGAVGGDVDG